MHNILIRATVAAALAIGGFVVFTAYFSPAQEQPEDSSTPVIVKDDETDAQESHPTSMAEKKSPVKAECRDAETAHASGGVDIRAIPLGDGKVSTSPKAGYVYSCETRFNGSGAEHAGDWIKGDTWDLTKKITVTGAVSWPSAWFKTMLSGVSRVLSGNGLPVQSATGIFPIRPSDPAYQYDRNPNAIQETGLSVSIPGTPALAATPSCVPMGPVGYALNGVAIYNALDAAGRDAVAHEVQDSCNGHPQGAGQYHYHGPSSCMPHADENNALVGYALDGFGIFSRFDARGAEYANADLDACHGITSEIEWNGKQVTMYHYVLTNEYPFSIGCFRGTPVSPGRTSGQQAGSRSGPPQEAIAACSGKQAGASCSFGPISGGTCRTTPEGSFACVPQ